MSIGILALKDPSKSKDLKRFISGGKDLGIDIKIFHPSDIYIKLINGHTHILTRDNDAELGIDLMINWIPYVKYDEIAYALKQNNIKYINSIESVRNSRNKMLTSILINSTIKQPIVHYYPYIGENKTLDISIPAVYKKKSGSHGIDAQLLLDENSMKELVLSKPLKSNMYMQEYIRGYGYDYRIIIVGRKIIGGMKKTSGEGEWRTHVLYGGTVENYTPSKEICDMCIKAMDILKLDFAGIDIIPSIDDKNYFLEINAVPGTEIFYNTTGINLGYEILSYAKELI